MNQFRLKNPAPRLKSYGPMLTTLTPETLTASVLAVPPLARKADYSLNDAENTKLIRHIESGGVRTLLYGGNANFYHIPLEEHDAVLSYLGQAAGERTLVIPSAGPAFGTMMDQAKVIRRHRFPTVMVLPQQGVTTPAGVEEGIKRFVQAAGVPALLYIKSDGYLEPENAKRLADQRIISGIKYATVRADPANDPYLRKLVDHVDRRIIISGIGEQPAIVHLRDFGLGSFTSGCVCVAPRLSAEMLRATRAGNWDRAEQIRRTFQPLEDLRNEINPIRVLHDAVRLAGIADTGPLLPLLSNLEPSAHAKVRVAAQQLLTKNAE
jgi:dihydrodipicolinate synthase/N-acetylneuraminate lyase